MKKLLFVFAIVSLVLTSCTDNTTEHEELLKINAVEKDKITAPGSGGGGDDDNSED
ncbi:conserved exported protein of unknown function [Tenacibaculum sp. 190524A02b]